MHLGYQRKRIFILSVKSREDVLDRLVRECSHKVCAQDLTERPQEIGGVLKAGAQILYESRGLQIVRKKWRLFYTTLYRELQLDSVGKAENAERRPC